MTTPLQIGDRIYYTGDMANAESAGTIVAVNPATHHSGPSVDIDLDDEPDRRFRVVSLLAFNPAPGRRFWLLPEYEIARQARMESFIASTKAGASC